MFFETLRVNTKLKFTRPSAGLEMPSIFCRTHGPTGVVVVEFDADDCHGQANLIDGRWMPTPTRCRAADRANSTAHATARRQIPNQSRRPGPSPAPGHPAPAGARSRSAAAHPTTRHGWTDRPRRAR